jgi:hypothetical protein
MSLSTALKPDLEAATQRWLAFWEHELIDRPVCRVTAPRQGAAPVGGPPYCAGATGDMAAVAQQALAWAETVYWGGEAIPCYVPSFGPDMVAAFLGAELVIPPAEQNYGTTWVKPCIEDWDTAPAITLADDNHWWSRMREFCAVLARTFEGQLALSHLDLHSNLDTLLAMRGGERLCMDFIDQPDAIDRAMAQVRSAYRPIYDGVYEAGEMATTGTLGWVPAYHPVRTNTIQCDFAALIGPRQFRQWAAPALEEEAAYLGHCGYHLDGPECLVHVDDLCAIPHLDFIQWTTGARNKPFPEWLDLLQHIQSRGTAVWIPCHVREIPYYHAELDPRLLWYDAYADNERQADEALAWLVAHT